MSDEIISALIVGFSTVLSCLLGIKIGKENSLKGMNKEVLQQQLDRVYSPIVRDWYQNPNRDAKDCLLLIQRVFFENFDLVMPSLFQQMMSLHSSQDIAKEDFQKLKRVIISNYNWNKKLLGYPYESSKIYSEHLPSSGKYQFFITVINAIIPYIGLCSLIFTATPLYNKSFYTDIRDSSYPYFAIISFYFLFYLAAKTIGRYRLTKEKKKQKNNSSQK